MAEEITRRGPYSGESRTTKWRRAKLKHSNDHEASDTDSSCSCEFHNIARDHSNESSFCSCDYHKAAKEGDTSSSSCEEYEGSTDEECSADKDGDVTSSSCERDEGSTDEECSAVRNKCESYIFIFLHLPFCTIITIKCGFRWDWTSMKTMDWQNI